MNKKFLLVILAVFFPVILPLRVVRATEGTVSGILKEKEEEISALREEVRKKVEEKLKTIVNERKKRGWIGIVEEKTATGLKLRVKNEIRTVVISEEVQVVGLKREKLSFDNIEAGQRLVAMGYLQPDNSLEARRIVFLPEKEEKRVHQVVFGSIIDKSKEEEILVITPSQNQDQEYEVILDQKTALRHRIGNKIEKIKYEEFQVGQKIIAVVVPAKSNGSSYNAKLILILSPILSSSPSPTPIPE